MLFSKLMNGEHELHAWARRGNLRLVTKAIDAGTDVNILDEFGRCALHLAAVNGHLEVLEYLVNVCEAILNIPLSMVDDRIALHMAVTSGRKECARFLSTAMVNCDVDVNTVDRKGNTPLHLASISSVEMVAVLVQDGFSSSSMRNKDGKTPMQLAATMNELSANFLINRASSNVYFTPVMRYLTALPIKTLKGVIGDYLHISDIVRLDTAWCNQDTRPKLLEAYSGLNSHSIDNFPMQSLESLKWFTSRNIDIQNFNIPIFGGRQPLHWACENAASDIFKLLMDTHKFNINEKDPTLNDSTPLHIACSRSNFELFDLLVREYHADVDVQDKEGRTPLHHSALHGLLEMSKRLVCEFNCKLNTIDAGGMTPLHIAAWKGRIDICTVILEAAEVRKNNDPSNTIDLDVQDAQGWTALHIACEYENDAIVKMLSRAGANQSLRIIDNGQSALLMACAKGNVPQTTYLLEQANAPLNLPNLDGSTPLHVACENGHHVIVSLLLENRAIPNLKNASGATALHLACENGRDDVVRVLLTNQDHIIDLNARNLIGNTPLHACSWKGYASIVEVLLQTGQVDTNAQDDMGWTPLYRAVMFGKFEIVKLLVHFGDAAIDIADHMGWTPIAFSQSREQNASITAFLINESKARFVEEEQSAAGLLLDMGKRKRGMK